MTFSLLSTSCLPKLPNREHRSNNVGVDNEDVLRFQIQVSIFHFKKILSFFLLGYLSFKRDKTQTTVTNTWNKRIVWSYLLCRRFTKRQVNDLKLCVCSNVCPCSVHFVSFIALYCITGQWTVKKSWREKLNLTSCHAGFCTKDFREMYQNEIRTCGACRNHWVC